MSLNATNAVWRMLVGDPTRKLILMKYADHAHADGRNAWCKPQTVADFAECSERTVQRHLTVLLAEGFMREGDQSNYVWPRDYTGPREEKYQPIVYDIALDEETRKRWAEEAARGGNARRSRHVKGGGVRRGDNVTPLNPQVRRGDNLTPQAPDEASEVTPGADSEVTSETAGCAQPDVTLVSPKQPSLNLDMEPSSTAADAAASPKRKAKGTRSPEHQAAVDTAMQIVRWYMDTWVETRKAPIPESTRVFNALVGAGRSRDGAQYVTGALLSGWTPEQVQAVLARNGREGQAPLPSKPWWHEALTVAAGGVPAAGGRGVAAIVRRNDATGKTGLGMPPNAPSQDTAAAPAPSGLGIPRNRAVGEP